MSGDTPPRDPYAAAVWLRRRHSWLDELMTRAVGPDDGRDDGYEWVEQIIAGFNDLETLNQRWDEYERRNRRPDGHDEAAIDRWYDAAPKCETRAGRAIGPMSGGEVRMLRLLTTLGRDVNENRCRQGWTIQDVDFDARGAAVMEDWIAVLRAQLPALQRS